MTEEVQQFNQWAIVEVFGHVTYAGRVSEQRIGDTTFIRVDVPKVPERTAFTKLFGGNAIYSMTIVDQETARAKATMLKSVPIEPWELRAWLQEGRKNPKNNETVKAIDTTIDVDEGQEIPF